MNYRNNINNNQSPNSSLTVPINEYQLQSLIDYWNTNSFYIVVNHNCSTIAVYSWYRVSSVRFYGETFIPNDLREKIKFNGGKEIYMANVLANV